MKRSGPCDPTQERDTLFKNTQIKKSGPCDPTQEQDREHEHEREVPVTSLKNRHMKRRAHVTLLRNGARNMKEQSW